MFVYMREKKSIKGPVFVIQDSKASLKCYIKAAFKKAARPIH